MPVLGGGLLPEEPEQCLAPRHIAKRRVFRGRDPVPGPPRSRRQEVTNIGLGKKLL